MADGLGIGHVHGDYYQYHFGNSNSLETVRGKKGVPYRRWNESDIHGFDGTSHEPGRFWDDGRTRNYPKGFAHHFRCWVSCRMAL